MGRLLLALVFAVAPAVSACGGESETPAMEAANGSMPSQLRGDVELTSPGSPVESVVVRAATDVPHAQAVLAQDSVVRVDDTEIGDLVLVRRTGPVCGLAPVLTFDDTTLIVHEFTGPPPCADTEYDYALVVQLADAVDPATIDVLFEPATASSDA